MDELEFNEKIAKVKANDPHIRGLYFNSKNLNLDQFYRMVDALKHNNIVESIEFEKQDFGDAEYSALANVLRENNVLTSIRLNQRTAEVFRKLTENGREAEILDALKKPINFLQVNIIALHMAATRGQLNLLNKLLSIPRIAVQANYAKNSPLNNAASRNHLHCLDRLLQVDLVRETFKSNPIGALTSAARGGSLDCYKRLYALHTISRKTNEYLASNLKIAILNERHLIVDYILATPNISFALDKFMVNIKLELSKGKIPNVIYRLLFSAVGESVLQANNYQICSFINLELLNTKLLYRDGVCRGWQTTDKLRDILMHCGFIVENFKARIATPEEITLYQKQKLLEQKLVEAQQLLTQVTQLRALHFALRTQPHKKELERKIQLYPAKRHKLG